MPFKLNNFQHQPQTIPDATPSAAGVMSAADKAKLDSLSPGGGEDFLDQFFSGGFNHVPAALTEIFRFTPDVGVFSSGNLTAEIMIFSHGGGNSTLQQTFVYAYTGSLTEAGHGTAVTIGDGTVNATVTVEGFDIVVSMTGSDETNINVFTVAKCRISNGEE